MRALVKWESKEFLVLVDQVDTRILYIQSFYKIAQLYIVKKQHCQVDFDVKREHQRVIQLVIYKLVQK